MEPTKTDLVVVGAGPGGYAAAFYAADLGKNVILLERDPKLGGVCLNRGCIPSKALLHAAHNISAAKESAHRGITFGAPQIELDKLRAWKDSIIAKLSGGITQLASKRGVTVIHGAATSRVPTPSASRPRPASSSSPTTTPSSPSAPSPRCRRPSTSATRAS